MIKSKSPKSSRPIKLSILVLNKEFIILLLEGFINEAARSIVSVERQRDCFSGQQSPVNLS